MAESVLRAEGASKRYDDRVALDGVSLALEPGERVALLGHNGAGKTTLMRLVLGLTRPSGGKVSVSGHPAGSKAARRACAWLPESVTFSQNLTGRELLAFYARLKKAPLKPSLGLLEQVGLAEAADRRIKTYSKGMRQRLGLAQALIGEPRLLLLDEPTSGLDPALRREFFAIVDERARAGAAVLISSHVLTELEARTDRVVILRRGRVTASDTLGGLRARSALPIKLRLEVPPAAAGDLAAALGGERVNGSAVELYCPPDAKMAVLGRVSALGVELRDLEIVAPSLDEIYRRYSEEGFG